MTLDDQVRAYSIQRATEFQRCERQKKRRDREDRMWLDAGRNSHLAAQDERISRCPDCYAWQMDGRCKQCGRKAA